MDLAEWVIVKKGVYPGEPTSVYSFTMGAPLEHPPPLGIGPVMLSTPRDRQMAADYLARNSTVILLGTLFRKTLYHSYC